MTSQMTVNLCSWETEYRTMNVIHSQLRSRPNTSLLWIWNRINLVILMKKIICTFFFINLSYATVSLKHHFIFISAGKERLLWKILFYLLAWNIKFIINKFLRSLFARNVKQIMISFYKHLVKFILSLSN